MGLFSKMRKDACVNPSASISLNNRAKKLSSRYYTFVCSTLSWCLAVHPSAKGYIDTTQYSLIEMTKSPIMRADHIDGEDISQDITGSSIGRS